MAARPARALAANPLATPRTTPRPPPRKARPARLVPMDFDLILRFLLALLLVLALIGLFAWAARRFGLGGRLAATVSKSRRLRIVEVTPLDPKTRLVLLRRDEVEHLVLLGATGATVIESGIRAAPGGFAEAMSAAAPGDDADPVAGAPR